jgi:hypothetical protein
MKLEEDSGTKIDIKIKENYIKADNNTIIKSKYIRWVKKIDECLYVCTKPTGCSIELGDTHRICKINNSESFMKLNEWFK